MSFQYNFLFNCISAPALNFSVIPLASSPSLLGCAGPYLPRPSSTLRPPLLQPTLRRPLLPSFFPSPGPVLCSPSFSSLFLRRVRFVSRRFFSQLPASCFLGLGGIVFLILVFCFFVLLIIPICNRQLCISYRFLPSILLRIPPLYSVHHGRSCSSVQYLSQASNIQ